MFVLTRLLGNLRKKLLVGFGFTGAATSSMLFLFIAPSVFLLDSFLVVVSVTSLGCCFVMLNSFLPLLVANHPQALEAGKDVHDFALEPVSSGDEDPTVVSNEQSFAAKSGGQKTDSLDLKLSTEISSKGVGLGYMAAVFVQLLRILLLFLISKTSASSTLFLRMVLFLAGVWWVVFTLSVMIWLRDRPGPPLEAKRQGDSRLKSIALYVVFAWGTLWKTIKLAARLLQAVIFLVAWLLLSDDIATVSVTAILFAHTEL